MDKKFIGLSLILGGIAAVSYATGKFCGYADGVKATAKLEDWEFAELKKEITYESDIDWKPSLPGHRGSHEPAAGGGSGDRV